MRLIDSADALVEAYRPGVLESLGLAPETLLERNGGLVIVRISGFGQTGPRRSQPGLGTLAEAYSGFASITGQADGPPMLPPVALGDESAALFATWSLLAALYWRDARGGCGQVIDVSLFESLYSLLGPLPTLAKHLGHAPVRSGSAPLVLVAPKRVRDGRRALGRRVRHRAVPCRAASRRPRRARSSSTTSVSARPPHGRSTPTISTRWSQPDRVPDGVRGRAGPRRARRRRVARVSVRRDPRRSPLPRPRYADGRARRDARPRHHAGPGSTDEPDARADQPAGPAARVRHGGGVEGARFSDAEIERARPRRVVGRDPVSGDAAADVWRLSLVRGREGLERERFLEHWLGPHRSTSRRSTGWWRRGSTWSSHGRRGPRRGTGSA